MRAMTLARFKERFKKMANPSKRTLRIVLASLGVLVLAWQQIEATRIGYQVESARKRARGLESRLSALRMELQCDLSPAQLALQARTRLGMQPASPEKLRVLDARSAAPLHDSLLSRLLSLWISAPA